MKRTFPALYALVLFHIGGCGLAGPLQVSDSPEIMKIRNKGKQRAWKLAVSDVRMGKINEVKPEEWPLEIDAEQIRTSVLDGIKSSGLFLDVERVPVGSSASGTNRENHKNDLSAILNESMCPFEFSLNIEEAHVKFKGRNVYFWPNLAFWAILSPLASWFIADEDYSARIVTEASLVDRGTNEPVWSGRIEATAEGSLDHFQRGIGIWDILPPGPLVDEADPRKVSRVLVPHLLRKLQIKTSEALSRSSPVNVPEIDLLICIGAQEMGDQETGDVHKTTEGASEDPEEKGGPGTESSGGNDTEFEKTGPVYCIADAEEMTELFRKRPGRPRVIHLSGEVNPEEIRSVLTNLKKNARVRIRDLVLFYAGPGTVVSSGKERKVEAALAFPWKAGAAFRVRELLRLIEAVPAGSRTVMLDTGFLGKGGRAVPPLAPKTETSSGEKIVNQEDVMPFAQVGKATCLLTACGPGKPGFESSEWKHGGLTELLLRFLKSDFDDDGDGKITPMEIYLKISDASMKIGLEKGFPILLRMYGDPASGVALWRVEK